MGISLPKLEVVMTDQSLLSMDDSDINPFVNAETIPIFQPEAIALIRRLASAFDIHPAFCDAIEKFRSAELPIFERDLEQRLAGFLLDETKETHTITEEHVMACCNALCKIIITWAYTMFPPESDPEAVKNSYPLMLVANMCKISHFYSRILGECVKHIIALRTTYPDFLPRELYNVIEGLTPLTGSPNSPLTCMELTALHNYLGSRKSIYVHIFLNSAFELEQQIKILQQDRLTEFEMITLCKSSWFFLFLLGAVQNSTRKDEPITTSLEETSLSEPAVTTLNPDYIPTSDPILIPAASTMSLNFDLPSDYPIMESTPVEVSESEFTFDSDSIFDTVTEALEQIGNMGLW